MAPVRHRRSLARTDSDGTKSAPPVSSKTLHTVQGYVDLKFPSSSSLPGITNSQPESSSAKYPNNENNKKQKERSNSGKINFDGNSQSNSQKEKPLQPPNLSLYRNFLSNKGKAGAFRGYKDSGTLVLGSTVNNIFNRKNKDFMNNNYLSRNKQESTELFPITTSSLPTMTLP